MQKNLFIFVQFGGWSTVCSNKPEHEILWYILSVSCWMPSYKWQTHSGPVVKECAYEVLVYSSFTWPRSNTTLWRFLFKETRSYSTMQGMQILSKLSDCLCYLGSQGQKSLISEPSIWSGTWRHEYLWAVPVFCLNQGMSGTASQQWLYAEKRWAEYYC